jgi:hypothetical protein
MTQKRKSVLCRKKKGDDQKITESRKNDISMRHISAENGKKGIFSQKFLMEIPFLPFSASKAAGHRYSGFELLTFKSFA